MWPAAQGHLEPPGAGRGRKALPWGLWRDWGPVMLCAQTWGPRAAGRHAVVAHAPAEGSRVSLSSAGSRASGRGGGLGLGFLVLVPAGGPSGGLPCQAPASTDRTPRCPHSSTNWMGTPRGRSSWTTCSASCRNEVRPALPPWARGRGRRLRVAVRSPRLEASKSCLLGRGGSSCHGCRGAGVSCPEWVVPLQLPRPGVRWQQGGVPGGSGGPRG